MRFYPHELSGGMKQRVCPGAGPGARAEVRAARRADDRPRRGGPARDHGATCAQLQREQGFAVLLISHDLGTVLEVSDRVMVMYAGEIVEDQPADCDAAAADAPLHRGLLGSYADPTAENVEITYIPGRPPDLTKPPSAAPSRRAAPTPSTSAGWTTRAAADGRRQGRLPRRRAWKAPGRASAAASGATSARSRPAAGLRRAHAHRGARAERGRSPAPRQRQQDLPAAAGLEDHDVHAVDDVSFTLRRGRVTALVGQSGSGKSTIARLITGVERPDSGEIWFGKTRVDKLSGRPLRELPPARAVRLPGPVLGPEPGPPDRSTPLMRPLVNYRG